MSGPHGLDFKPSEGVSAGRWALGRSQLGLSDVPCGVGRRSCPESPAVWRSRDSPGEAMTPLGGCWGPCCIGLPPPAGASSRVLPDNSTFPAIISSLPGHLPPDPVTSSGLYVTAGTLLSVLPLGLPASAEILPLSLVQRPSGPGLCLPRTIPSRSHPTELRGPQASGQLALPATWKVSEALMLLSVPTPPTVVLASWPLA